MSSSVLDRQLPVPLPLRKCGNLGLLVETPLRSRPPSSYSRTSSYSRNTNSQSVSIFDSSQGQNLASCLGKRRIDEPRRSHIVRGAARRSLHFCRSHNNVLRFRMGWHGVGSLNSPIVISDDEDETLVERALEDRFTDPQDVPEQDFEPFDYGEDDTVSGPSLMQGGSAETTEITVISGAFLLLACSSADRFEFQQIRRQNASARGQVTHMKVRNSNTWRISHRTPSTRRRSRRCPLTETII